MGAINGFFDSRNRMIDPSFNLFRIFELFSDLRYTGLTPNFDPPLGLFSNPLLVESYGC